jgi:hypothetical protein
MNQAPSGLGAKENSLGVPASIYNVTVAQLF